VIWCSWEVRERQSLRKQAKAEVQDDFDSGLQLPFYPRVQAADFGFVPADADGDGTGFSNSSRDPSGNRYLYRICERSFHQNREEKVCFPGP
jgi:hypothetical protein